MVAAAYYLWGLGGAGKTAVAARSVSEVLGVSRPAGGLFVWSFYQEPDAGLFLRELVDYFARPPIQRRRRGPVRSILSATHYKRAANIC